MSEKTTKEQIIEIVKNMESQIGTGVMGNLFDKENGSNTKIGSNQFRNIAATCRKAESYEEIEMMIQYSIAKVKGSNSWKTRCANRQCFGVNILNAMHTVRELDHEGVLNNLEMFFGYMYWQVRIWADTYGSNNTGSGNTANQQNGRRYDNQSRGNYQNHGQNRNRR